ncbi:MAG: transcriptional repressor [Lachnospiraceae bacterium]|nr:transcriptional repressor [Lachnospiraceae bacterium]
MATLKYSRQRESIKTYLQNTTEHPTADIVYAHVRKEFPNISLGTVYRNLNLLAETGDALKISTPSGGDRFDGVTKPHYHFICTCCGKVIDLDMESIDHIKDIAGKNFAGKIESHITMFYGKCKDCNAKS